MEGGPLVDEPLIDKAVIHSAVERVIGPPLTLSILKARSNERNMLHATSSNIVARNMLHRLNTLLHDVA